MSPILLLGAAEEIATRWDEPGVITLNVLLILLLVLLNGFFVAAEFALVKIRDTQLETLVSTATPRTFRELQEFLTSDGDRSYADVGQRLGLATGNVRVTVHRLRQRYGTLLRKEIAPAAVRSPDGSGPLTHVFLPGSW